MHKLKKNEVQAQQKFKRGNNIDTIFFNKTHPQKKKKKKKKLKTNPTYNQKKNLEGPNLTPSPGRSFKLAALLEP